jgi:hypothetical protein
LAYKSLNKVLLCFNGSEISIKYRFVMLLLNIYLKKILLSILVFFGYLKPNAHETDRKKKKTYFINTSWRYITHLSSGLGVTVWSKRYILCTLVYISYTHIISRFIFGFCREYFPITLICLSVTFCHTSNFIKSNY